MRALAALFVTGLAAAQPAAIRPTDSPTDAVTLGGDIVDMCSAHDRTALIACGAYLRGAVDGLLTAEISRSDDSASFCPPSDEVAESEIRQIFLSYVRQEPGRRSEEASMLVLSALEDRFPCADDDIDGVVDMAAWHRGHRAHRVRRRTI